MRMMDLPMTIDTLRYFAGWADKLEGRTIPTDGFMGRPTLSYTRRAPVGVAGQIVPWNAPLMIAVWKLAPALAAGCPVVIKPSEDAPLAVARLGKLACEAGLPAGVVNIVHGMGAEVGAALVAHPLVSKISFTGSTEVGRTIACDAARTFKRVTLELGGKAAQIVFADADLDRAIPSLVAGMFANQGQTCAAGSRVLAHRSIADALEARLADAARTIRVGPPTEAGVQMGALINPRHLARVRAHVAAALAEGAVMLAGDEQVPPRGCFMRPTILGGVHPGMRIAREEVFGPVGMVMPFETEDDAIRIANDTPFGLSASVWTQDVGTAHRVAERLDVGAVAINAWSPIDARLPWAAPGKAESGVTCRRPRSIRTSRKRSSRPRCDVAAHAAPHRVHALEERYLMDYQKRQKRFWHPMSSAAAGHTTPTVIIARGDGNYVYDVEGHRMLDGVGGLWNVNVGHNRPEVKAAIARQMDELSYYQTFDGVAHPRVYDLADRLCAMFEQEDMQRVMFGSGGSDAIETALKMARQYWVAAGEPSRTKFLSLRNGYHGVHMGGTSIGGNGVYHYNHGPLLPGCVLLDTPWLYRNPWNCDDPDQLVEHCIRQLEDTIAFHGQQTIAAFVAEPVQGAGGLIVPPAGYWARVRNVCDRHGILLIADEVVTGFGRTGSMLGSRGWGVAADILCVAKGISAGYVPLGATLYNGRIAQAIEHGAGFSHVVMHGYTYSGHPLACRVARRTRHRRSRGSSGQRGAHGPTPARAVAAVDARLRNGRRRARQGADAGARSRDRQGEPHAARSRQGVRGARGGCRTQARRAGPGDRQQDRDVAAADAAAEETDLIAHALRDALQECCADARAIA
jgi:acyl-CoA reductase-like NAD-dependent aldehyde dehydrogenase/adenosylmethionine-8-amino-7-oxononanoate aminotransferase